MHIKDRIYGLHTVTEPVLCELLTTAPVRRLTGINQAGASQYVVAGKTVTRYEHSVGVMLLIRLLGGSLEEQIAGLLHDVPHTAFSHVIDFVFANDSHEYHEKFHSDIIMDSEIPVILAGHNLDVHKILDHRNFPLLERELPDLCADRIDYTLRDMTASIGYKDSIPMYISNLTVSHNEIVFTSPDIARQFALDFLYMDETRWSHPYEIALFQILAEAIKIGLHKGILAHDDLFQNDSFVYNKLNGADDPDIRAKLSMINPSLIITDDPDDYHFFSRTKLRFVNPKFLTTDGTIARVSDHDPEFDNILAAHKERVTRGSYIKILSY